MRGLVKVVLRACKEAHVISGVMLTRWCSSEVRRRMRPAEWRQGGGWCRNARVIAREVRRGGGGEEERAEESIY
jgi:hypothetical protein